MDKKTKTRRGRTEAAKTKTADNGRAGKTVALPAADKTADSKGERRNFPMKTTTIERIIDKEPVPDMVFLPRKKTETMLSAVDEVPEVVLPKTKAEVVEAAQKRLSERDPLAGRVTRTSVKTAAKTAELAKTGDFEGSVRTTAKTAARQPAPAESKTGETRTRARGKTQAREEGTIRTVRLGDNVRERIMTLRKIVDSPKIVGKPEDLVPFSWRQPLKLEKDKKMSRVFKTMTAEERARALLVPVRSDDSR